MYKFKSNSLRCMMLAVIAAQALLGLPAVAQKADASLLDYSGPERMDRIIAAAKKEGSLNLYTSISEQDLPTLIKPFEAKYGVKVNTWRAGSDKVLQRTISESNAKRHEVDLIQTQTPELEALSREKILQPVNSPVFKDLHAGAVPKHREWVATLLSVFVQAYNTNLVKKEDLPKTYKDLLDPKWKGRLGIEAKDEDWFASVVTQQGGEAGIKLFRDIVATNGISIRKGHSLLTNLVAAGEIGLALTVYNYMPPRLMRKGAPVDWFVIEPAITRANGAGIARNAPHPNAALLFYEFILGEGQNLLVGMDYVPSNTKVKSPLGNLKLVLIDPTVALDEQAKWERIFKDTMSAN